MLPNPSNSLVALLIRFFDGLVPLAVPVDGAIDPSALSNEFVLAVGAILLLWLLRVRPQEWFNMFVTPDDTVALPHIVLAVVVVVVDVVSGIVVERFNNMICIAESIVSIASNTFVVNFFASSSSSSSLLLQLAFPCCCCCRCCWSCACSCACSWRDLRSIKSRGDNVLLGILGNMSLLLLLPLAVVLVLLLLLLMLLLMLLLFFFFIILVVLLGNCGVLEIHGSFGASAAVVVLVLVDHLQSLGPNPNFPCGYRRVPGNVNDGATILLVVVAAAAAAIIIILLKSSASASPASQPSLVESSIPSSVAGFGSKSDNNSW